MPKMPASKCDQSATNPPKQDPVAAAGQSMSHRSKGTGQMVSTEHVDVVGRRAFVPVMTMLLPKFGLSCCSISLQLCPTHGAPA